MWSKPNVSQEDVSRLPFMQRTVRREHFPREPDPVVFENFKDDLSTHCNVKFTRDQGRQVLWMYSGGGGK